MSLKDFLSRLRLIKKDKRTLLLDKINKAGYPEKEVFVSVADFFDGNNDIGSIGANIYPDPPSLLQFCETLLAIESNEKTNLILIRIADIEDSEWFYSDMVFINGHYSMPEIKKLFKSLKSDEIYEGLMYDEKPNNIPDKGNGKSYSVWWD